MKAYVDAGLAGDAIKKCDAIYQIDILDKKGGNKVFDFYIDLRKAGQKVDQGQVEKPDATFTMTDADFYQMCNGKLNPQRAFLTKKMKITGNFKKATAFTPDLFPKPTEENIKKYTEKLGVKM